MKALLVIPLLLAACGGLQPDKDMSGLWLMSWGAGNTTLPATIAKATLDKNGNGQWTVMGGATEPHGSVSGNVDGDQFKAKVTGSTEGEVTITATIYDQNGPTNKVLIGTYSLAGQSDKFSAGVVDPMLVR